MRRFVNVSIILAVAVMLLTGCNCYNKMAKRVNEVQGSVNPELLSLKGNTVSAEISVTFPAKYFQKTAVFKVTPVLVYDGGEIAGAPKYMQGESVQDNYTVMPYKTGGTYTQTVTFPYDEKAKLCAMELRVEGKCKNNEFSQIAVITVAQGISTVQNDADWTAAMAIMPDNFKRVTTITQDADVVYNINSDQVRKTALNSDQIKLFEDFVKENSNKDRTVLGSIYAKGYASPDGPVKFNDDLSRKRSESGKKAISKQLKGVTAEYDAAAYGEDWEGFKELVEASNIKDKDLILQVLQMYSSPVQRDQEIKNMSQVYDVLKKDILPQLRRTKLVANADITGKTDEELVDALKNDINALNVEEMLFSATLVDDNALKAKAYKTAGEKFNCVRGYNNYGVLLAKEGKLNDAKAALDKAASIKSAPEVSNNLGVIALAEGNTTEARKYIAPLATPEAKTNMALIALAEGDYATAVRGLDGYNLAVAEFCNGNLSQAKAALGNLDCAYANYLRAVIAMREGDTKGAIANLKNSIAKDSAMKAKAKGDVEFAKIFVTSEFKAL
jgi:tetratricopeptide (TPR) repeat protein